MRAGASRDISPGGLWGYRDINHKGKLMQIAGYPQMPGRRRRSLQTAGAASPDADNAGAAIGQA